MQQAWVDGYDETAPDREKPVVWWKDTYRQIQSVL